MMSTPGPRARTENLAVIHRDGETIVYDQDLHHIHRLNDVSRAVWDLCDGHRSLPELTRLAAGELGLQLNEHDILVALNKLHDARLLKEPLPPELRLLRTTRRTFTKRAAATLAVITSISAPVAAAAASGCSTFGKSCEFGEPCCEGLICMGKVICE